MSRGSENAIWAEVFLDELARSGVREICVAPGSRSTPLVLAVAGDRRFRSFSVVDERSAGFFALGMGKASGRPAAVITTSGTGAANLYPAVIEASQGEVPLLVLTADRPHRLRDTDGNQAMDQLHLFGTFPRAFFEVELPRLEGPSLRHLRGLAGRAVSLALGPPRGPVHLNFPFEKPLEPGGEGEKLRADLRRNDPRAGEGRGGGKPYVRVSPLLPMVPEAELSRIVSLMEGATRGLIVAGPLPEAEEAGAAVLAVGAAAGFPILADPLSGARFSHPSKAQVVAGYDLFLRSPDARRALEPDLILRIGGSPTSSGALDLIGEAKEAHQIVVDDGHRWKDHPASAHDYVRASPSAFLRRLAAGLRSPGIPEWKELWREAEARTRRIVADRGSGELLEGEILAEVVSGLPEGGTLLVASSMPIRDLDAFGQPVPKALRVFGNRGASGIDGLVSTTLGIAVASELEGGLGPGGEAARPGEPRSGRDVERSGGRAEEGSRAVGESGAGGMAARSGFAPPTVGVLGDLAFFHDMNGLLALKALRSRVVFVVVNNDGGGIFHALPIREHEPAFSRFFATPHGLDFCKAGELYDLPFLRATSLEEFKAHFARALQGEGPWILEVRTRREETHERRRALFASVDEAMKGLGQKREPERTEDKTE